MLSGKAENVPYSLSRWTEVPGGKWEWFKVQLQQGWMTAFDQRTSIPEKWSLKPEDTLGLIFWTKDPRNLVKDRELIRPYKVKVHFTLTGWVEVERGAPGIFDLGPSLGLLVQKYGADNITWRFSPIPVVESCVSRFKALASAMAVSGIAKVFFSFLQKNDRLEDPRTTFEQAKIVRELAEVAKSFGITPLYCNEDKSLGRLSPVLKYGVCAPPEDFDGVPSAEGCGCTMAVDPFTVNESCVFGCKYCYAADLGTAPKKRNTTRLPVLR